MALTAVLAGCATDADGTNSAASEINENEGDDTTPRLTSQELGGKAEAHFTTANAAHLQGGKNTAAAQIDDAPELLLEGSELIDVVPPTPGSTALMMTGKKPVFRVQMSSGANDIGTFECAKIGGAVVLRLDTALFKSSSTTPCSITIAKIYDETLPPTATLVGARPRVIRVVFASATVTDETGKTHDFRVGFTIATKRI